MFKFLKFSIKIIIYMETIKSLLSRRSVSQLTDPAPSKDEMDLVYQTAFRAPDHAWLRPWRFIEIRGQGRKKLAECFLNSVKKIEDIDEERAKKIADLPFRSPMIIVKTKDTRTKTRKKNTMNLNHKAVFLAIILCNFSLNSVQKVKSNHRMSHSKFSFL